jgi:glycosyltransferase involved in cell wall biosynthesis
MVDYLEETMQSVLSQDYPNLEYIVVDGGSTDGSVDTIRRYEDQLAWWVSEEDGGMYEAIQKGFSRSSGEIMAWINADDILHRRALFSVGEIFSKFPDVRWVQGRPTGIDESGRIVTVASDIKRWSRFHYYIGKFRWIQQESTFWRRSLWERAGGEVDVNLKYAGDLELWARFFRHSSLHVTEAILGAFRKRSEGQLSAKYMDEYLREAKNIILRERERLSIPDIYTTKKLRFIEKVCYYLRHLRFLDVDKLWGKAVEIHSSLPPVIRFDRRAQTFVKGDD